MYVPYKVIALVSLVNTGKSGEMILGGCDLIRLKKKRQKRQRDSPAGLGEVSCPAVTRPVSKDTGPQSDSHRLSPANNLERPGEGGPQSETVTGWANILIWASRDSAEEPAHLSGTPDPGRCGRSNRQSFCGCWD